MTSMCVTEIMSPFEQIMACRLFGAKVLAWNNNDLFLVDHFVQMSLKFESKSKKKLNLKCLQNINHFCSGNAFHITDPLWGESIGHR